MKKTLEIKGMTCGHCEARVKKALEAIDGVDSAQASASDENAVITFSKDVDEVKLRAAVEEAGYEFVKVV